MILSLLRRHWEKLEAASLPRSPSLKGIILSWSDFTLSTTNGPHSAGVQLYLSSCHIVWMTDWLNDWLTEWLTECLTDLPRCLFSHLNIEFFTVWRSSINFFLNCEGLFNFFVLIFKVTWLFYIQNSYMCFVWRSEQHL